MKTYEDLILEGLFYDNDMIKEKINNYDKEIASDNELINKFKSITGYEVLGIPYIVTVKKYGVEIQRNILIHCGRGKSIYRVSLSGVVLINSNIGKLKCSSVKKVEFNKNSNIDLFFNFMKKIKNKLVIKNITANKKSINIYFDGGNKNYIADLVRADSNMNYSKVLNKVMIYNKSSLTESASLEELTALASINPIKPTSKPFILKMEPMNSIFAGKCNFAFSPDIVSDKYLVINEDSKLEIVGSEYLDNYKYSLYEFTGDKERVGLLYKAYKENQEVSSDFIYSCLSGKDMLMEDQICFDDQFKLVNINEIFIKGYEGV